jgi:signal transduction histidine kinase
LPLGIIESTILVTAISVGVGTAVMLIGIPILIGTVYAWRWLAVHERRMLRRLTGGPFPSPYRPDAEGVGRWARLGARLADPATWKDLVFLLLQLPAGIVSFTVAVSVLGVGASLLLAPAWYWAIEPDGIELGLLSVNTLGEALAVAPLGALILLFGIPALGALGRLYAWFAGLLLGSNADPVLTARVTELQDARSRIIAAADGERRRIERDLHDGAQQRLVALALNLRMAQARAEKGDPEAGELIRSAGEEANLALKELRDLARGIHPAILTNRGLRAALEDLATRSTVPVEILESPEERLPDQVEAAAYFVVSECLANVSKHAEAESATVAVRAEDGRLTVTVADDGRGGARLASGYGLQGLEDRVGALNGEIELESPPGRGTRVRAIISLAAQPPPAHAAGHGPPRRVLPDAEAPAVIARRRRGLRARVGVLAGIALTILAVWALTGAPNAWPVWPLLGLGLIGGLDAWLVLAGPPLLESQVARSDDGGRALRRHRSVRLWAGALAILNIFLIGIWLASGSDYFWPVWSILGCAIAVGLKALRPFHELRHSVRSREA